MPASRTLVLGGARSGKSAYAESLVAPAGVVRYVATARVDPSDNDFRQRIAAHRQRRPADWTVVENADLADTLDGGDSPTLVDDIGTWLTNAIDDAAAWTKPRGTVATEAVVAAVAAYSGRLVLVSPEVGFGVVPASAAGRLFRDELGSLNQRLAQVCEEVFLVVAGVPMRVK